MSLTAKQAFSFQNSLQFVVLVRNQSITFQQEIDVLHV
jgi:hypothetical protein